MNNNILIIAVESLHDEIFSYEESTGFQYHWNVTMGRRLAEARNDVRRFSLQEHGITIPFIHSQYTNLNEAYALTTDLSRPILLIPIGDKFCLADGWHRLFRAVMEGVDILPAYFLTEEEAGTVLICTLPPGEGLDWGQPKPPASRASR
jgi:hypothetical protein